MSDKISLPYLSVFSAMLPRFLVVTLLALSSCPLMARMLPPPASSVRYYETRETASVWAKVGNEVRSVGTILQGQRLAVRPQPEGYGTFHFGNGEAYIDLDHLQNPSSRDVPVDRLGELAKTGQHSYLVTWQATPVHSKPQAESDEVGVLAENLRYPILSVLRDRLNQTWFEINIGGRLAYVSGLDAQPDNGIPVLTYHHILRDKENTRFRHTSTTTSVQAFNNQMTWLRDRGYATLTMGQLEDYLKYRENLPARAVVITFDDGLKSVYRYAYPLLHQYGFKATAFVVSSRIKRHPQAWNPRSLQFMSISELEVISDVFEIESHTHFLHRLDSPHHAVLLSRSYHNILFDFERSRRALTQFNPHVRYLSYPFGIYNASAVEAAKVAGFHLAVTTVKGKVKPGDDPLRLKRLYILRTDSLEKMAQMLANQPQG
ncbi:hypothetical protein TUM12370_31160 [Salmonella enterica subsp. enterica serovar Choleraesuis]|nr:hypothetical protein TUM12370_31160 [Salmonella enterica subsp. enterica serovar Choleraesuis]